MSASEIFLLAIVVLVVAVVVWALAARNRRRG
jgi:cbb3-type cytochrome oxidase subunit 3